MHLYLFFLNVGRWQIQAGSGILAAWVEFERRAPTCTNSSRTSCSNGLLSPTVTTEAKCILEAMLFCLCSLQAEPLQQFFEKPGEEPQPPQACQIWKRSLGCCSWHFRVDHERRQPFKCLFCRVVPQEIWVVADRHKDEFSLLTPANTLDDTSLSLST